MESHFRIALENGLSEDELAEVIYHASGYAGFPPRTPPSPRPSRHCGKDHEL